MDSLQSHMDKPVPPSETKFGGVMELLVGNAVEACVLAFLILLLGGLALDMVGGIWKEMTPSLPPAWNSVEAPAPSNVPTRWSVPGKYGFHLLAGALFAGMTWMRLARNSSSASQRQSAIWLGTLAERVSKKWFGLLVGNAFIAMVSGIGLGWAQQFSFSKWCIHGLLELFHPVIYCVANLCFDSRQLDTLAGLFAWYDYNQMKFIFWFLYLAAICDDLGLPNIKTWGRMLWRRLRGLPTGPDGARVTKDLETPAI